MGFLMRADAQLSEIATRASEGNLRAVPHARISATASAERREGTAKARNRRAAKEAFGALKGSHPLWVVEQALIALRAHALKNIHLSE